MSTTESAASQPRREILPWVGHNAWWLQVVINTVVWVWILFTATQRGETPALVDSGYGWAGAPGWWANPVTWLVLAVVITNFWLGRRARQHNRSLCERCAAITPLDPAMATHKHRRALLAHHGGVSDNETRPRRLLAAAIISTVFLLLLLGILAVFVLSIWFSIPAWANVIIAALFVVSTLVYPYVAEIHRRLYPWCPFCADDDGWDDGGIPEPSPTPTREKELT